MTPLITLTTDFGEAAPYVAVMKGVIQSLNPVARLLDLTHRVRPQDVRHASYFLGTAVPYFPPGTIHLAVVDPGVGGERAALCVEAGGQYLVGPDNGVFTGCIHALGPPTVHKLTEAKFWRPTVSATFHGRDVFAPATAHLSLGVRPADLGPAVESWVELTRRPAVCEAHHCRGEVQFVDDFGNLITNVPAGAVTSLPVRAAIGGGDPHPVRWVRTYSDAAAGKLVCLFSSDGWFEVAVVKGSAARQLGVDVGTPVELHFE